MDNYSNWLSSYSNYTLTNKSNLFNFLIKMFENLNAEQKKQFVCDLKLIMGNTVYRSFRAYVFEKIEDHEFLSYK